MHKKFIPLTPPPVSNNKKIEVTRTRSLSFSSNKITANNNGNNNDIINNVTTNTTVINANKNVMAAATEDSSQSSLNLSSSGYLSGSSVNSNSGSSTSSNINLNHSVNVVSSDHHHNNSVPLQAQQQVSTSTTSRRRTTSTNSNGGTQRSPCILRAGTREVHNKLEKHRRAHLKECFEQLRIQLQLKDEEKKKPSNLTILGAAYRHVMSLRRRERELEQQVEQLAKDKINAQKKILSLKRELSVKYDNIDLSNIISDGDIVSIPEREFLSDTASISSGRGSLRYSSSSSLSSVNTVSSPVGSSIQNSVPATLSSVISCSSLTATTIPPNATSPCTQLLIKSSSPISTTSAMNNVIPLPLTTKNHYTSPNSSSSSTISVLDSSPVPSTPSPSPSSSSGISCSPIISTSPPNSSSLSSSSPSSNLTSEIIKLPNVPNGLKLNHLPINSQQSTVTIVSTNNGDNILSTPILTTNNNSNNNKNNNNNHNSSNSTNSNIGGVQHSSYGFTTQNVQITACSKELTGKNGVCRKIPSSSSLSKELNSSISVSNSGSGAELISVNGSAKEIKVEKFYDESEQPTKVIKLFNGIALASVDKDNKLLSSAPLALSQVVGGGSLVVSPFPMLTTQSQSLRVFNATNGLAAIELSSPASGVQTHNNNRSHQQQTVVNSPTVTAVTSASANAAQLHKLLVNAGTQAQVSHPQQSHHSTVNPTFTHSLTQSISNANITPELARLPGGAELNILPASANGQTTLYRGNGKLAIVNNGITLKGTESNNTGRAVHVVTPIQSGGAPISGLTPIVVSQGQQGNNLAQLIASSSQLTGKVNLSVGGQTLPIIGTQYLSSMKPMVVAVANNSATNISTANSVSATAITENGNS